MPRKATGVADDWREIDRFDGGVGWIGHPEEDMQRASHALTTDDGVYVVEPVDGPGIDDLLSDLGEVAGVVVLLDRHTRDTEAVARRHDVPVYVPESMAGMADDIDAPTELFSGELGDSGYEAHSIVHNALWKEAALYNEDERVLVVPEAVGTLGFHCVDGERVGVHPVLRLKPPRRLREFEVDHLLVGHGPGLHEGVDEALENALSGSRRRAPRLFVKSAREFLPV